MRNEIKSKLERLLGVSISRCRKGSGSMRKYLYIRVSPPFEVSGDWNKMHNQIRGWIESKLGFVPFYVGKECGNDFGVNLNIEKLESL